MTEEVKKELKEIKKKEGWKKDRDINWNYISLYQTLSEDFIREFKNKVNWNWISYYQKLSEDFIREFQDEVSWYNISEGQKLLEDFIREFQDKVEWDGISYYQYLSSYFIYKFRNKLNTNVLIGRKLITQEYLDYMNRGVKHNETNRYALMDI